MEVVETKFDDVMSAILAKPSSESLRQKQDDLKAELREQMKLGNAPEVMRIQYQLRDLPAMIVACSVSEIKDELRRVEETFKTLKVERQQLTELKQSKVKLLSPVILEYERLNQEVQKVDLALGVLDEETASAHSKRRSLKTDLQELMDGIKNNEQF